MKSSFLKIALVVLSFSELNAQIINTVAGTGVCCFAGDGALGTTAKINQPTGLSADGSGNVFFADLNNNRVRKISFTGTITTLAGTMFPGFSGDGGNAYNAQLNQPTGVGADFGGNVYVADCGNNRIRMISWSGIITTFAGNGTTGFGGDGGLATNAQLNSPTGVAADLSGNVYITDKANNRVRMIDPSGIITTFAGTGVAGFSGDGGLATSAQLNQPTGIFVDNSGNVYFADRNNHRIRMVNASGIITTIAGNGTGGFAGDGSLASSAQLNFPHSIALLNSSGDLYIGDQSNARVRVVNSSSIISTYAGNGIAGFAGDGGNATSARLNQPAGIGVDPFGNVYIGDCSNHRIRKVNTSGIISTYAGTGVAGFNGDGGYAVNAQIGGFETGMACDIFGNVFIDDGNSRIRKIDNMGIITAFAGDGMSTYGGDGGPATQAQISPRTGVAADAFGNVYIADYFNNRIRKVDPSGIITTYAGTGVNGNAGDGGLATNATISNPITITCDAAGNVYFSNFMGNKIRKINTSGIISTFAGTGVQGFSGDGGPATNAQFYTIDGLAFDVAGNMYVCDYQNLRVRKINTSGIVSTFAGNGTSGFSGDGGPATSAQLCCTYAITTDGSGNVYIEDGNRIRKINSSGIITTIAGSSYGYGGDGGPATSALFKNPMGVACNVGGELYIYDTGNYRVRKINLATGLNNYNKEENSGSMFPNPSSGVFYLELNEDSHITITNMIGQEILDLKLKSGKQNIDLRDQANGIYLYRIMGERTFSGRIIKH